MLENMGLTFQGHQHSGIDDARNIARIVVRMLEDGADLRINERLYAHKLRDIALLEQEVCPVMPSDDESDSDSESPITAFVESDDVDGHQTEGAAANVTHSLDRLQLNSSSSQGQNYNTEEYDDLLSYYALQSS